MCFSSNESIKNGDKPEMMDTDCADESLNRLKRVYSKSVDNLFEGLKLNDNHRNFKNNIIRPQRFAISTKRDKVFGYAESSPGHFSSFSTKDDLEFDTHSVHSQPIYRSHCSSLCHQTAPSYPYTPPYVPHPPNYHPCLMNLSQSSNTSNMQQQPLELQKMLIYSIPGIVLFSLQWYLLYDIKDFMKQK